MTKNEVFIIEPTAKVTYINKLTNEFWDNWKLYKDCDEKEKLKINLSSYPSNCILFDRDLKNFNEEQIDNDYKGFVQMLKKRKIDYFYSYRSPNGYHILAPFKDLENLEDNLRKELRKYYINLFLSDPAKISDKGVVSLPGKPHFKNGVVYDILENREGLNVFPENIIKVCKDNVAKQEEIKNKILSDKNFENYFEEDPFFLYVKTNIIPDGTNRDLTIFPNLAIAAVKSELDKKEIDDILKPVIKNNFPGKTYQEFEGWYKKAKAGQILDYNPIQINNWMREYSELKTDVYDTSGLEIDLLEELKSKDRKRIYADDELDELETESIEWLIDGWIRKGDFSIVAGKSSSFKTTACIHIAYALSKGLKIFNKYDTTKSTVLYIDEENNKTTLKSMIDKIKTGLGINNKSKEIYIAVNGGFRLDIKKELDYLVKFLIDKKIEVLFLDAFKRFFSGKENDADVINEIYNILKYIRIKCKGITIIALHHLKKEGHIEADMRDMLRGSSEIVNIADSIIGIRRKSSTNYFSMEHIKNRGGEELKDKCIAYYNDDKEIKLYTKTIEEDKRIRLSEPDKCSSEIVCYLEDTNLKVFKRKDLANINKHYPYDTITKAIRNMLHDGTLTSSGYGKYTEYFLNVPLIKEDKKEDKKIKDEKQQKL